MAQEIINLNDSDVEELLRDERANRDEDTSEQVERILNDLEHFPPPPPLVRQVAGYGVHEAYRLNEGEQAWLNAMNLLIMATEDMVGDSDWEVPEDDESEDVVMERVWDGRMP